MKIFLKKCIVYILKNVKIINRIDDKRYISLFYRLIFRKKLNLENPKTFNEKLQWLKLYDRKDNYTVMVDKFSVKEYVSDIIGSKYIIPTLGIYDNFNQIDFELLPNKFVIKSTHDSGAYIICNDKSNLDLNYVSSKINKSLKRNFYYAAREWPYKNVKPRIIIEKYMEDKNSDALKDYKIFCFNGEPKSILVCSNRSGKFKNTDFYDKDWNLMPFTRENHMNNPYGIKKPKNLAEMLDIAAKLSKDIPFVRVDLYEINGQVYFGELTFFPSGGFEGFKPLEYDKILGDWLKLPKKKVNKK